MHPPPGRRLPGALSIFLTAVGIAVAVFFFSPPVDAGHELPFYPSFYPQEITVKTLDPAAAATRLARNEIHAYVGGDPFAGGAAPSSVSYVTSLQGYVVAEFNGQVFPGAASRCAAAARLRRTLPPTRATWVAYPYPVTPHHSDYLAQYDLAETAKAPASGAAVDTPGLRVRARGAVAETLLGAGRVGTDAPWDATVEHIPLDALLRGERAAMDGWLGPPWRKTGWSQAYLLLVRSVSDAAARRAIETTYERLASGRVASAVERINLERQLVTSLIASCERVVLGYTVRREPINVDYSQGVENVARDSQDGLDSAIFLRTAKLKDFPWNGWLHVAVEDGSTGAWNPIAGFTDRMGRLVWSAVGDPALLPSPHGAGVVSNRVSAAVTAPAAGVAVPIDSLAPEPGTGVLKKVGAGKRAAVRIEYRVRASAFHDGTKMSVADALYPLALASRWSAVRDGRGGAAAARGDHDAALAAWSARLRDRLVAVRPVKVETLVREYSDVKFIYDVPVIEVYLDRAGGDDESIAIASPWSSAPWHVLALMDEAARRGLGAFSHDAASARGVAWLDLVRDPKQITALAALADELRVKNYVPSALKALATADDARARWSALKTFFEAHRHFLVANGPYRLERWSPDGAVLQVFRDMTYPLGVGTFDDYAIPLRAWVAKVDDRGDRLEIRADVERVSKFAREYELVREPMAASTGGLDMQPQAECRYVVVDAKRTVVRAGTVTRREPTGFTVGLSGLPSGRYTILLMLPVLDNTVDIPITTVQHVVAR